MKNNLDCNIMDTPGFFGGRKSSVYYVYRMQM